MLPHRPCTWILILAGFFGLSSHASGQITIREEVEIAPGCGVPSEIAEQLPSRPWLRAFFDHPGYLTCDEGREGAGESLPSPVRPTERSSYGGPGLRLAEEPTGELAVVNRGRFYFYAFYLNHRAGDLPADAAAVVTVRRSGEEEEFTLPLGPSTFEESASKYETLAEYGCIPASNADYVTLKSSDRTSTYGATCGGISDMYEPGLIDLGVLEAGDTLRVEYLADEQRYLDPTPGGRDAAGYFCSESETWSWLLWIEGGDSCWDSPYVGQLRGQLVAEPLPSYFEVDASPDTLSFDESAAITATARYDSGAEFTLLEPDSTVTVRAGLSLNGGFYGRIVNEATGASADSVLAVRYGDVKTGRIRVFPVEVVPDLRVRARGAAQRSVPDDVDLLRVAVEYNDYDAAGYANLYVEPDRNYFLVVADDELDAGETVSVSVLDAGRDMEGFDSDFEVDLALDDPNAGYLAWLSGGEVEVKISSGQILERVPYGVLDDAFDPSGELGRVVWVNRSPEAPPAARVSGDGSAKRRSADQLSTIVTLTATRSSDATQTGVAESTVRLVGFDIEFLKCVRVGSELCADYEDGAPLPLGVQQDVGVYVQARDRDGADVVLSSNPLVTFTIEEGEHFGEFISARQGIELAGTEVAMLYDEVRKGGGAGNESKLIFVASNIQLRRDSDGEVSRDENGNPIYELADGRAFTELPPAERYIRVDASVESEPAPNRYGIGYLGIEDTGLEKITLPEEGQVWPTLSASDGNDDRRNYLEGIEVRSPNIRAGDAVLVSIDWIEGSGGHQHRKSKAVRELPFDLRGEIEGAVKDDQAETYRVIAAADGVVTFDYKAGIVSGEYLLRARGEASPLDVESETVYVRVPSLIQIPQNEDYQFIGETANHEDNHYATSATIETLEEFVAYVADKQPDWMPIGINDSSLRFGGIFDISGNWKPSHITHRDGEDIDVRAAVNIPGECVRSGIPVGGRDEVNFVLYGIELGIRPDVHSRGTCNQHYHLYF